jgi:hypothetical protein
VLDLDGGAPWDLLCVLMQAQPRKRLSAARAAAHPALGGGLGGAVAGALTRLGDATDKVRVSTPRLPARMHAVSLGATQAPPFSTAILASAAYPRHTAAVALDLGTVFASLCPTHV